MTQVQTSFEVVTAKGRPIHTFADRARAVAFAKRVRDTYPGLKVEEVTRMEQRRAVWSARHLVVGSAR